MTDQTLTVLGIQYLRQTRVCNKPTCKCHEGQPHGPYWYARSETGGPLSYIGKELPAAILKTHAAIVAAAPRINRQFSKLIWEAKALQKRAQTLEDTASELRALQEGHRVDRKQLPDEFRALVPGGRR